LKKKNERGRAEVGLKVLRFENPGGSLIYDLEGVTSARISYFRGEKSWRVALGK